MENEQVPTRDRVAWKLSQIFKGRVRNLALHGFHCTFTITTERYERLKGNEVEDLWKAFDITPSQVEFWEVHSPISGVEFSIDLDAATPILSPTGGFRV